MLAKQLRKSKKKNFGFMLAESIVVLGIVSFALVSGFLIFTSALKSISLAKLKSVAIATANEFMETYRNMPYASIGTTTGWPPGSIPANQTVVKSGYSLTLTTRVDFVDDPFDGNAAGTIAGKPRDTAPNDYKKLEIKVKTGTTNLTALTAYISARGLESAPNSGSLLIKVFNASGEPVPEATVTIDNSTLTPGINITNTTDLEGNLQVLSLPPALQTYHVSVSKDGYTSEETENPSNPNYTPIKPHISILANEVTEASFTIDKKSALNIKTLDENCQAAPNLAFRLQGNKLKGTNPDTKKNQVDHDTDSNGRKSIPDIEWDTYSPSLRGGNKDIIGQNPPLLKIEPGASQELILVVGPRSPHSLLLTVNDAATLLPLTDAEVTITRGSESASKITGRGFFIQSDWSGGSGQEQFSNVKKYSSDDGNIDTTSCQVPIF